MTTTIILLLLVLIELARLALQYRRGKTLVEQQQKTYCTSFEVENRKMKVWEEDMNEVLLDFGKRGYEIAAVTYSGFNKPEGKHYYTLFFTKKKIKNFKDD